MSKRRQSTEAFLSAVEFGLDYTWAPTPPAVSCASLGGLPPPGPTLPLGEHGAPQTGACGARR
eukprot:3868444-Alexandrium_andersonii.AAC.1